ncbi:hypothetical protein T4D_4682 [Trichinella pseudospiralis]|uniref:Uncharacterized protein n=1 Tax=Trichinella pseudospiralis TaxID=6337 RepID=A0A0V1FD87_TRIPS|nr:hypothetical protein T4D_4682 [Trichinella pseudospiralis]
MRLLVLSDRNRGPVANLLISTRILGTVDYSKYRSATTTTVVTKTTDPTNTSLMIFSTEGKHRVGRLQTITAKAYGAKGPGRAVICCWTQHLWLSQARGCDTAKRYPLQALTSAMPRLLNDLRDTEILMAD